MNFFKRTSSLFSFSFFVLVLPFSTNYEMRDFGFGAGGSGVSDSSNYSAIGILGETSGQESEGTDYNLGPGLIFTQQANVPGAPTFNNTGSWYNKLFFDIDTGNNPSDAQFAIAISTDDFTTTNYIQADNTIGATAVYQTEATWGASGAFVIGLTSSTTYKIKVKAIHTKYTETGFSAESSATTSGATLTYDIDVSSSDSETGAPYALSLGTISTSGVTTASDKIWIDLSTNAEAGGFVYVYNSGTGLTSSNVGYTITSSSTNLSSASEGFGIRVDTTTESAGGPLIAESPYDSSGDTVGVVDTTTRTVFSSSAAPITSGRGSILVKARASNITPAAGDYTGILTMIASATF